MDRAGRKGRLSAVADGCGGTGPVNSGERGKGLGFYAFPSIIHPPLEVYREGMEIRGSDFYYTIQARKTNLAFPLASRVVTVFPFRFFDGDSVLRPRLVLYRSLHLDLMSLSQNSMARLVNVRENEELMKTERASIRGRQPSIRHIAESREDFEVNHRMNF